MHDTLYIALGSNATSNTQSVTLHLVTYLYMDHAGPRQGVFKGLGLGILTCVAHKATMLK